MQKVAIRFKDYEGLFYVVDNQGKKWVALRPLLAAIGADVEAELAMIRADNPLRFYLNDFDLAHYIDKQDTTTAEAEPCFAAFAMVELFPKLTEDYNWAAGFLRAYEDASSPQYQYQLGDVTTVRPTCTCCGCAPNSTNTTKAISKETIQEIALKRIKK